MRDEVGGERSPLEEALATLQENPQIIAQIADAIGMEPPAQALGTSAGEAEPAQTEKSEEGKRTAEVAEKLPLILSAIGAEGLGFGGGAGRINLGALMGDPKKKALLRALCPYLGPARRGAAETILRLWSVGDILGGFDKK